MRVSTLSARWFGFFLLLIAGTVGCAESGTGVPASLTAPSSLSVGPSAAAIGPGAGYDATGMWRFVTTFPGEPDEIFDAQVTQAPNGDFTFEENDGPVTLERLSQGDGKVITYRLFGSGPESGTDCDVRAQGTARLDTTTNTLTANVRLKELGCDNQRVGFVVTATKL
jgi:hypothetical protein